MDEKILIGAFGIAVVVIPISFVFFKIKKPIEITISDQVLLIMWLFLTILVSVDLYYTIKCDNVCCTCSGSNTPTPGPTGVGTPTPSPSPTGSGIGNVIEENYDLIQKLKTSYSESDTEIIENDEVEFRITEKAGIAYRNLNKTGASDMLSGVYVSSAKVFFLDYSSDNIICERTSVKGTMRYAPEKHDKFYCVVAHNDYDLYVTPPIQAIGGESYGDIDIYLDKKNVEYTPVTQIRLYVRDSKSNGSYSKIPPDYMIRFHCAGIKNKRGISTYEISKMPDSGLLSYGGCSYFSLSTEYEIDISLYHQSDDTEELAHQTFDGFVPDSNVAEIIFELDNENDTSE